MLLDKCKICPMRQCRKNVKNPEKPRPDELPILTLASAVRHHDRLVLALGARETIIGSGTPEAVKRTGSAVAGVEHVLVHARFADHYALF